MRPDGPGCTFTLRGIPIGVWSEATTLDKVCATGGAGVNLRKILITVIVPRPEGLREMAWFRKLTCSFSLARQKEPAGAADAAARVMSAVSLCLLCEVVVVASVIAVCSNERHAFGLQCVTVDLIAERN